uniref:CUT domain-containing protein n=1 Tax=Strongyloides papillosus TaxID=174720 RepID=A0A0N5BXL6_STREA
MSVVKSLKIRFKNNTGDEYETVENTHEIPIPTENITMVNKNPLEDHSPNNNISTIQFIGDLPVVEGSRTNSLQINDGDNCDGNNTFIINNVNECNVFESQVLEKETNSLFLSDGVEEMGHLNGVSSNENCMSKELVSQSELINTTNERSISPSSVTTVDRESLESVEHFNEIKFPTTSETCSSTSRSLSDFPTKSYNNPTSSEREALEKTYNPDDKDEYRKHIETKMSQLWMLVDDFGKANTQYVDKKFFDFEDFFKNEEKYKNMSYEELNNCVTDAYKQLEDISSHINTKTELSRNYKADMIVQATYLKDQLCKLEKFTDQQELENEERRNRVEKKLEAFYKRSVDDFKESKVNITLDEFMKVFNSYHKFRVEKALQGETSSNDTNDKDKKHNKENNKENEKRVSDRNENTNTPEDIRNQNIEFIRQITGRYSYTTVSPSKAKKDKPSIQKIQNKTQNISQLQCVERKCDYTLENCPELIRDISRLDYSENGFKGRLNIDTLCQEMRNYLLTHTISRYHFSQKVLGMSGGALNELLNKPRVFDELTEKGITSFLKIRVYLDIVKSKGPYEGKKLSQENVDLIERLNKYYQGK